MTTSSLTSCAASITAIGAALLDDLRAATALATPVDGVLAGVERVLAHHAGTLDTVVSSVGHAALPATPGAFCSRIVHAESQFSVVVLTLPPGAETSIHDHLTWCTVAVVRGAEHEETYRDHDTHLELIGRSTNPPGSVTTLTPPGDIHRVRNDTDTTAMSLHVYGADLRQAGSSVRRIYDVPVR